MLRDVKEFGPGLLVLTFEDPNGFYAREVVDREDVVRMLAALDGGRYQPVINMQCQLQSIEIYNAFKSRRWFNYYNPSTREWEEYNRELRFLVKG